MQGATDFPPPAYQNEELQREVQRGFLRKVHPQHLHTWTSTHTHTRARAQNTHHTHNIPMRISARTSSKSGQMNPDTHSVEEHVYFSIMHIEHLGIQLANVILLIFRQYFLTIFLISMQLRRTVVFHTHTHTHTHTH